MKSLKTIKLFHSYQYIPEIKNTYYSYEKKCIVNNENKFVMGLLNIPVINGYKIIIEKYITSRRLTKKMEYKNHTLHNIKIFYEINLDTVMKSKISSNNKKKLFYLIKKNFNIIDKNTKLQDLFCINNNVKKSYITENKITLKKSNIIHLYDFIIDINRQTISNKPFKINTIDFLLKLS